MIVNFRMSGVRAPADDYVSYHPGFIGRAESAAITQRLWLELAWSQQAIRLFGKRVLQPRLVAWYGDRGAVYTYSGLTLQPLPWHPLLLDLRGRIELFSGYEFNAVLANAYRNGRDSMGWHADDEKALGPEPALASLSLGAARRFRLRPRPNGPAAIAAPAAMTLESGSLLVMHPGCQERFQHALPRTRTAAGLRINLTFRRVEVQAPD